MLGEVVGLLASRVLLFDDPVTGIALDDGFHLETRVRSIREDEKPRAMLAHRPVLARREFDNERAFRLFAFADALLEWFGRSLDDSESVQAVVDLPEEIFVPGSSFLCLLSWHHEHPIGTESALGPGGYPCGVVRDQAVRITGQRR